MKATTRAMMESLKATGQLDHRPRAVRAAFLRHVRTWRGGRELLQQTLICPPHTCGGHPAVVSGFIATEQPMKTSATAKKGLADVDEDTLRSFCEKSDEDYGTAEAEVMGYIRARVGGDAVAIDDGGETE